jgi:hypothetical protein
MMSGTGDSRSAREMRTELSTALKLVDEPQDWGIVNADGERVAEFVTFLAARDLASTQVFDMVELVLASANEWLLEDPSADLSAVQDVLRLHSEAAEVHGDYWASLDDAEEFPIGAWLRGQRSR